MTTIIATDVRPFRLSVPDADLVDLRERLARTRWASDPPAGVGWSQGVPVAYLKELTDYWCNRFDWRAHENELNSLSQFTTTIDGQHIHFLHVRSRERDALPLLLAHGYPTSALEFSKIIGPLTNPRRHGGDPVDAFHVVAPSIPGFGLSNPVTEPGWEMARTARAFAELMRRLGYQRYALHGADIGAGIVGQLAGTVRDRVIGMHIASDPGAVAATVEHMPLPQDLPEAESARLAELRGLWDEQKGYLLLQSNRPLTLAHALTDSPVAQLAWIVDSFKEWTDPAAKLPHDAVDIDQLLANVTLYWLTRSGASAAQFLYATAHSGMDWVDATTVPQGWAVFNTDTIVRRLMDPDRRVEHWAEFEQGGHYPAMEVPELLVTDIRSFFRELKHSARG
jgi:epoxide hydrolase